jgi:tetratricopeptide (TPR) repeat protein
MPNMRADRLMYLPSLPACIGLAAGTWWIGARLATRTGRAAWRWIPLLAWIVVQGAAARGASATYRSDRRLWEIGLRRAPDSARAHAVMGELLGLRYVDTGSGDAAILGRARAHCRLAVAYDPLDPLSWLCHGRLDVIERAPERAFRNFERALGLAHQRREAIGATLAEVTLERRDLPFETRAVSAVAQIEQWRAWAPYSATVAQVAGDLHHRLGLADRALAAYSRASSLRPERWDLVARRVELQLDLGHPWAAAAALAARTSYDDVDPARRSQLVRRLAAAQRLWPTD